MGQIDEERKWNEKVMGIPYVTHSEGRPNGPMATEKSPEKQNAKRRIQGIAFQLGFYVLVGYMLSQASYFWKINDPSRTRSESIPNSELNINDVANTPDSSKSIESRTDSKTLESKEKRDSPNEKVREPELNNGLYVVDPANSKKSQSEADSQLESAQKIKKNLTR